MTGLLYKTTKNGSIEQLTILVQYIFLLYIHCLSVSSSVSLPAFKFLNAMLMQPCIHSYLPFHWLSHCNLLLMVQPPPSIPDPPFLSYSLSLSHTLSQSLSLSSLEASRFSSLAFSHNAVERVNGWGAFKRAVGGSGVWPQRVYCLRERELAPSPSPSLSRCLTLSLLTGCTTSAGSLGRLE